MKIVSVMDGTTELKSNGHQFPNKHVWETNYRKSGCEAEGGRFYASPFAQRVDNY